MTGPHHYQSAEDCLSRAAAAQLGSDLERYLLARAQVHATLALAAATAIRPADYGMDRPEWTAWTDAAGVEHAQRANRDGGGGRG
jgi:hypothetical protein